MSLAVAGGAFGEATLSRFLSSGKHLCRSRTERAGTKLGSHSARWPASRETSAPTDQPGRRSVPAAGPPTLPQDFLHPGHGETALGGQRPNDLASGPVGMLCPQRRDTDARDRAPIQRPPDAAVNGAALGSGRAKHSYEFFRAGGAEGVLGSCGGDELGDAIVGMLGP